MTWYVEIGGIKEINEEKRFTRNKFINISDFDDDIRKQYNNTDYYASIYIYDNNNIEEANLNAPFYIDIDHPKALSDEQAFFKAKRDTILTINTLNSIYKIPKELIRIYFSGAKGFHLIIPPEVFGIEPFNKLNMVYYIMAQDLKKHTLFNLIDLRYDNRRLFRVNNSINSKTGLYKTALTYDTLLDLNLEKIKSYASTIHDIEFKEPYYIDKANELYTTFKEEALRPKKHKSNKKYFDILMPCVLRALDEGACHGNRNNTCITLASSLFQTGMEYDKVVETMIDWNREKNVPRLSDKEIVATVKSADKEMTRGVRYGCTKYKEFGYCVPGKCGVIQ